MYRMAEGLCQMIYVSQALIKSSDDLRSILTSARTLNQLHHISGMLLYNHGQFMQCIEGTRHNVSTTYQRIRRDTRHDNIAIILDHTIDSRDFDSWLMAFKDFSLERTFAQDEDVVESDFLNLIAHSTKGVSLLASFAAL